MKIRSEPVTFRVRVFRFLSFVLELVYMFLKNRDRIFVSGHDFELRVKEKTPDILFSNFE